MWWKNQNPFPSQIRKGCCVWAEGIEIGRAEGREEGRAEEKKLMASRLKAMGVGIDVIIESSGLTREEIEKL